MHACKRAALRPAEVPPRLRGDSLFTKLPAHSVIFPCDSASVRGIEYPSFHNWKASRRSSRGAK